MICGKCGFDMTAKVVDQSITVYKCPLGHKYTEITSRPSATKRKRGAVIESTYPDNLERKLIPEVLYTSERIQ